MQRYNSQIVILGKYPVRVSIGDFSLLAFYKVRSTFVASAELRSIVKIVLNIWRPARNKILVF